MRYINSLLLLLLLHVAWKLVVKRVWGQCDFSWSLGAIVGGCHSSGHCNT